MRNLTCFAKSAIRNVLSMLDSVLATEKTTKRAHKTHVRKVEIIDYSSYSSLPSGHSNYTYTSSYDIHARLITFGNFMYPDEVWSRSIRISEGLL